MSNIEGMVDASGLADEIADAVVEELALPERAGLLVYRRVSEIIAGRQETGVVALRRVGVAK